MLTKRRRKLRAVYAVLFLVCGSLIALFLAQDTQSDESTLAPGNSSAKPELSLMFGRQKLQLNISTGSAEHETAVLQVVRELFGGVHAQVDFHTSPTVDSDWATISTRLLHLVASTDSAQAAISDSILRIRGTSSDADAAQQQLSLLRDVLSADMVLDADILTTGSTTQIEELCARSFAPIAEQTIHFRQTSTRIRESSLPLLDRLIEFAYDCRDAKIAVIGHTDSTGQESWNVQVSLARAQAVADYVTNRGISSDRLLLEGAGSGQPLGDNNTVAGRERNRRIEFELR